MDFTCNVCGKLNTGQQTFEREGQNCTHCHSTVRTRALMYVLSMELFGIPLPLPDFPTLKTLRVLGISDSADYSARLPEKFDYKNTFYDREPRLDITDITGQPESAYDIVISSEVFEHVRPPIERALLNTYRLLRPQGLLLLSIPYHLDDWPSVEHFPNFADAGIAQLRGGPVLVNRTAEGKLEVFDSLIFHGGAGATLELRMLNESALRAAIESAGFKDYQFYADNYAPFGIKYDGPWSLPIAVRKQKLEWTPAIKTEIMQRHEELHEKLRLKDKQIERLDHDIARLKNEVQRLHQENAETHDALVQRTEWANKLDEEVHTSRAALNELQTELESRTAWAQDTGKQLDERNEAYASLHKESEERTRWALDLQSQLEERTNWAQQLQAHEKQLETELNTLRSKLWTRIGRRLGLAP